MGQVDFILCFFFFPVLKLEVNIYQGEKNLYGALGQKYSGFPVSCKMKQKDPSEKIKPSENKLQVGVVQENPFVCGGGFFAFFGFFFCFLFVFCFKKDIFVLFLLIFNQEVTLQSKSLCDTIKIAIIFVSHLFFQTASHSIIFVPLTFMRPYQLVIGQFSQITQYMCTRANCIQPCLAQIHSRTVCASAAA